MNMDSKFENPTCSWGAIKSLQLKEMKLQETANIEQRLPFIDPSETHWPSLLHRSKQVPLIQW